MKIHEYQARQLLADAGVPVPPAEVVSTPEAAQGACEKFGSRVVVKAQVFAGGRGKAGFVKLCETPAQVCSAATFMLNNRMVSKQTGPEGIDVSKLLVVPTVEIDHEYYVGMVIDRTRRVPVIMVSREGGVEIEEVAARNPDAITKAWLHPHLGLQPYQVRQLTAALGLTTKDQAKATAEVLRGLVDVFCRHDASLAEINPLVLTKGGDVLAIDAKISFDDNALYRQPDIEAMHDPTEDNAAELRAKEANLSYIALDGKIGCLVNGAGLAMATMDIIKFHGGEPANFLDVGGGVTKDGAIEAFRIILADANVKAVLVNIFGGIARCDTIAEALIAAAREIGFKVPVIVRLEGTNVERARELLGDADIKELIVADDLTDAAKKACDAA